MFGTLGRVQILIPKWTMAGIIPPLGPDNPGHGQDRSPYRASLEEIIDMFVTSQQRADILIGFLDFRNALYAAGVVGGFQWLDGSFSENIEDIAGRPPNDIDVVTFFDIPGGHTQQSFLPLLGELLDPGHTKEIYRVDGYYHPLGEPMDESRVQLTAYWYSMWSHRRDGTWKGFVQLDLDPAGDAGGVALINNKIATGFEP